MKIIYLSTARIPDEWAHVIQLMKTCEAFARAGHEVELLVPRRARTSTEDPYTYAGVERNFVIKKLPCIDLFAGTQSGILYWLRTASFLVAAKIYLTFKTYNLLYTRELLAAKWMPRSVLELHNITPSVRSFFARSSPSKVVVISNGIRDELIAQKVSAGSIVVAPDAVDLDDFKNPESKENARKRLGIPLNAKVALYIGILEAWKGVGTLYEASSTLYPDITTVVIGGFPEELPALRAQYPNIIFTGFRSYRELPDNQAVGDVMILPNTARDLNSSRYTSPLKLFTYMASGNPIVASDLPSIREVLDESSAVLVKPDDAQALAEGVKKIFNDPAHATLLSESARKKVEGYTWQKRAETILDFLLR